VKGSSRVQEQGRRAGAATGIRGRVREPRQRQVTGAAAGAVGSGGEPRGGDRFIAWGVSPRIPSHPNHRAPGGGDRFFIASGAAVSLCQVAMVASGSFDSGRSR